MHTDFDLNIIPKILDGTATASEKEEFNLWVSSSPDNKKLLDDIQLVWNNIDKVHSKTVFDKKNARQKINQKIESRAQFKAKRANRTLLTWVAAAASILLLIGLFLYSPTDNYSEVYATTNSIQQFTLPDSSKIWLNKNSTLSIKEDFNQTKREVVLEGEAFFDVARDEQKPFSIATGVTITEVLGTSFNIYQNNGSGEIELIVKSGKVNFRKKGLLSAGKFLIAGDKGVYTEEENKIVYCKNTNKNYLAWQNRELTFYETPLDEVVSQLSKFYEIEIINNTTDTGYELSAKFNDEALEDVLKMISITFDFEIQKNPDSFTLNN